MIPHAIKEGDILHDDITLTRAIAEKIAAMPDHWVCHDICKELAAQYPQRLTWVKGKFNGFDHSWLTLQHDPNVIIDAHPWACGSGPFIITTVGINPWKASYVPLMDTVSAYDKIKTLVGNTTVIRISDQRHYTVVLTEVMDEVLLVDEHGRLLTVDSLFDMKAPWSEQFAIMTMNTKTVPPRKS